MIGDGSAYSEGAAYGSDQSTKPYSPYSVYGNVGDEGALFDRENADYANKKKAVLAETKNRLNKIPGYVDKKQWFNVNDELTRYMYETRGAMRWLATTDEQKKIMKSFFESIEKTYGSSTQRNAAAVVAANESAIKALDAFVSAL